MFNRKIDIEVYRQCNEHLKETDKKRDQIVGFLAVIVSLILANLDKFSYSDQKIIIFGLAIAGLFVILSVIHYMKWHFIYVQCIQVLYIYLRFNDVNRSEELFSNTAYKKSSKNWLNPIISTETAIFNLVNVIAFIPYQLFLQKFNIQLIILPVSLFFVVLINLIGFLIVMNFFAFLIISHIYKKSTFDHWILRGIAMTEKG